jgi:hypothetical protein
VAISIPSLRIARVIVCIFASSAIEVASHVHSHDGLRGTGCRTATRAQPPAAYADHRLLLRHPIRTATL